MKKIFIIIVIATFLSCTPEEQPVEKQCGIVLGTVLRINQDGSSYVSAVDFGNGFIQITKNNPDNLFKGKYFCVE